MALPQASALPGIPQRLAEDVLSCVYKTAAVWEAAMCKGSVRGKHRLKMVLIHIDDHMKPWLLPLLLLLLICMRYQWNSVRCQERCRGRSSQACLALCCTTSNWEFQLQVTLPVLAQARQAHLVSVVYGYQQD